LAPFENDAQKLHIEETVAWLRRVVGRDNTFTADFPVGQRRFDICRNVPEPRAIRDLADIKSRVSLAWPLHGNPA
jgi:hypothetical protein